MSHGEQFTLYTHVGGPNGWKVAYLLAELRLTYESVFFDFAKKDQKSPEFLKLNPNGRIPAIIDHGNNDFVLWESNAILLYIVEKYDKEHKFSAVTDADKAYQNQWLFFQASGQGPYFGQFFWFQFYHQEKVPSAVERYKGETERVLGVLESVLSKQEWLVAGKMTISDISFISWNNGAFKAILGDDYPIAEKYPAVYKWHNAMTERPAIKACIEQRTSMMSH
ncbi:glutathione S-transferase C-terminal-like protein [Dacryopinax primogenitus]|uniref:glutathione transferase n=1 Tax=Dacryopinax primogenitus (strain DJM 731) TaxID=1858805 RepID=M5FNL9_DACPD|nr:glutathione S-transferase C-terminal-like protein [Dacryopinax primogenitus]EJT97675.1 glutathione S-transferase C-terminal-like protein [Dacryopinax primogenitus]